MGEKEIEFEGPEGILVDDDFKPGNKEQEVKHCSYCGEVVFKSGKHSGGNRCYDCKKLNQRMRSYSETDKIKLYKILKLQT